jgi:folate-binding protein YgfZ
MSKTPAIAHVDCIAMEGVDARHFAQTQLSGDVDALMPEHWQWNAWLTAQGRVQALMHLADVGDGTLLAVLRGGDAQAIHAGLSRYLLRADAHLRVRRFTARAGLPSALGCVGRDRERIIVGFGARGLALEPECPAAVEPEACAQWRLADIWAGWPTLPAEAPEFLPPALALERLAAVSFDKGCYPGQEIAARLHWRGGHKYGLCHVQGTAPLPAGGTTTAEGARCRVLDQVPSGVRTDALVVLPIDVPNNINLLGNDYQVVSRFSA